MTVAELIAELQKLPGDAVVVQARDGEGNSYSPTAEVAVGRYKPYTELGGDFGLLELTPELTAQGYGEEDVPDGPVAVGLWPTN